MDLNLLLHRRILVVVKEHGYKSKQEVEELKILEVSPSKGFVKVQNMNGHKFWKHSSDVIPIEVLANPEAELKGF